MFQPEVVVRRMSSGKRDAAVMPVTDHQGRQRGAVQVKTRPSKARLAQEDSGRCVSVVGNRRVTGGDGEVGRVPRGKGPPHPGFSAPGMKESGASRRMPSGLCSVL